MATANKTSNLGLCAWLGTDKPSRIDFVEDNEKIDTAINDHVSDTSVHLSTSDRQKLTEPYVTKYYSGDGASSRTIAIGFSPKVVFVFKKNSGTVTLSGSNLLINTGMSIVSNGSTGGVSISGTNIIVKQTTTAVDGAIYNLNLNGGQYGIIAFR